VNFIGGHHITFEGNAVYETGNNAVRMNSGNTDSFVIRGLQAAWPGRPHSSRRAVELAHGITRPGAPLTRLALISGVFSVPSPTSR
jgi:hypothetical protein